MVLMKSLKFFLRQILPRKSDRKLSCLVRGFGQKFHIYLFLNLGKFGREKVVGDVPDRKLAFLYHVKKLQILHFSKGVSPWF